MIVSWGFTENSSFRSIWKIFLKKTKKETQEVAEDLLKVTDPTEAEIKQAYDQLGMPHYPFEGSQETISGGCEAG